MKPSMTRQQLQAIRNFVIPKNSAANCARKLGLTEAQVIAAAHGMGLAFEGAAPPPKAKPSRVTCNPAAIKLALEQLK